jgi:hypothetical protein
MIHPAIQLTRKVWRTSSLENRRHMKINFILVAFLILSAPAVAQQIADSSSTEASLSSTLPDAPSFQGAQNTAPQKDEPQVPPDAPGTMGPMGPIGPVPPPMTNARLTLDDKFRIYTHQTWASSIRLSCPGSRSSHVQSPEQLPSRLDRRRGCFWKTLRKYHSDADIQADCTVPH